MLINDYFTLLFTLHINKINKNVSEFLHLFVQASYPIDFLFFRKKVFDEISVENGTVKNNNYPVNTGYITVQGVYNF